MKALIIDDDIWVSRLFRRSLSDWAWEAEESHSVASALDRFRGEHYDLALCDVDLPDGNGISLARALMKARPELRVIMISGNPANLERAREAGLRYCLPKPFDLDRLRDMVALADPASSARLTNPTAPVT